MIRYHAVREISAHLKKARGRNRVSPISVGFEGTTAEAIDFCVATAKAGEEMAPGYMPLIRIELFDKDAFSADPLNAKPLRTVEGEELEALLAA